MTNNDVYGYKPFKVCDGHFHLSFPFTVEDSLTIYKNVMEYFNYDRAALMVYVHDVEDQFYCDNAKALYFKDVLNKHYGKGKIYACGSLMHYYDERDTSEGYLNQMQTLYSLGFDGVKWLDGKPACRKKMARRLDDPIFDKAFAYAEEMGMPFVIHVGDPPEFWDITKISEHAIKRGWFCDETFPTLEQLREETEGVLKKFPKLDVTLAHFYFISQDLEACEKLFETYPNVSLDLTPGGVMFANFSQRIDDWRRFFVKYADRIHYGTDTYNMVKYDNLEDYGRHGIEHRINLVRRALEKAEPFEDKNYGTILPLNLDDDTLTKIYRTNFIKKYGEEPRDVSDYDTAAYTADVLMKYESGIFYSVNDDRNRLEIENLRKVYTYFTNSDPVSN